MIFVICAPSGAGKTSISREVIYRNDLELSISYTTRPQRNNERDGVDYFFIDHKVFEKMKENGDFIEYAIVHGNFYGTSRKKIEEMLSIKKDILLEIDWQGAHQVRRLFKNQVVSIFILPPSINALRERLVSRAQDSVEIVDQRLKTALEEMQHLHEFDYAIINRDLEKAVSEFGLVVEAERCGRSKNDLTVLKQLENPEIVNILSTSQ